MLQSLALAAAAAVLTAVHGLHDIAGGVHRSNDVAGSLLWVDALQLAVGGRAFPSLLNGTNAYSRLPPAAEPDVTPAVWGYGQDSSGMFVQFASNSSSISVAFTLKDANQTVWTNFPPIGYSGVDLYRYDNATSQWRWVASSFEGLQHAGAINSPNVTEAPLFADSVGWPVGPMPSFPTEPVTYRYRLHLPSYNGVTSVQIGRPAGTSLVADSSFESLPSIVYYSTSIGQGGLTPRPGVTFMQRLGRLLDVQVFNLGFCGSCRMELGIGKWVATAANGNNAGVVIVDCAWNMIPSLIATNAVPFLTALRAAVPPSAAIVVIEPTPSPPTWLIPDEQWNNLTGRKVELLRAFNTVVAAGAKNMYYVPGATLFQGSAAAINPSAPNGNITNTDPIEDVTFEGVHPFDYGHMMLAESLTVALRPLIEAQRSGSPLPTDPFLLPLTDDYEPAPTAATTTASAADSAAWPAGWTALPVTYTDATQLTIRGRAFNTSVLPSPYNRLPSAAHGVVRDAVWTLSLNSAGLMVSFTSDSPGIYVNYTAADVFEPMVHFPVTGISGCDLYAYDDSVQRYRFVQALQLEYGVHSYIGLVTPPNISVTTPGKPLRWLLYLPTYNAATSVQIGVISGSSIAPDEPFPAASITSGSSKVADSAAADSSSLSSVSGPILWYGTSILEGGVAFRPGNIFTSVISRALATEVFNFGFSGNGKMELNVAQYLTAVPAGLIIVDCNWNMDAGSISQSAVPLVQYFRAHGHASTPIVLAEGLPFGRNWAVEAQDEAQVQANAALYGAYQNLTASGDKNLYYVTSASLWHGNSLAAWDTPTANALHPTDAGHRLMAATWVEVLRGLGFGRRAQ